MAARELLRRVLAALVPLAAATLWSVPGHGCGRDSDCVLGERSYRILLPEGAESPSGAPLRGAVIFAHGYRGSAVGVMQDEALAELARERNVAILAPDGIDGSWNLPHMPGGHAPEPDETAYVLALRDRLVSGYGIDHGRIVLAGFSAGGMLVWNLACTHGPDFAGFAPMSGTFWAPVPARCPTLPTGLMHFHGSEDTVVPMAGRAIGSARQGNVHAALDTLAAMSDFGAPVETREGELTCARREDSARRRIELCTFPGPHGYRTAFLARAIESFLPQD